MKKSAFLLALSVVVGVSSTYAADQPALQSANLAENVPMQKSMTLANGIHIKKIHNGIIVTKPDGSTHKYLGGSMGTSCTTTAVPLKFLH